MSLFLLLGACGGTNTETKTGEETTTVSTPTTVPTPTDTPTPKDHVAIPGILDAPLVLQKMGADGSIPSAPDNDSVEVVDFTDQLPGYGGIPGKGNTVMIGNKDSGTSSCNKGKTPPPCDAVMKDLHNVSLGSKVEVGWQGKVSQYEVVAVCSVSADLSKPENWQTLLKLYSTTQQERVTLFTFGGNFNQKTFNYDSWLVVIAEKPGTGPMACPAGTTNGPPRVTDSSKGG